jgi:hypothetical protein
MASHRCGRAARGGWGTTSARSNTRADDGEKRLAARGHRWPLKGRANRRGAMAWHTLGGSGGGMAHLWSVVIDRQLPRIGGHEQAAPFRIGEMGSLTCGPHGHYAWFKTIQTSETDSNEFEFHLNSFKLILNQTRHSRA